MRPSNAAVPCYGKDVARVTSKFQVTLPKALAEEYGIRPGCDIDFLPAGDAIRVVPPRATAPPDTARRLALFDAATRRQRERQSGAAGPAPPDNRGWRRDELYERAGAG